MGYLLRRGAGLDPAPFSPSASGSIAQGGEDADADRQEPGGDAQRKQGIARHQLPAFAHKVNDGFHGGHYGGHAGGHGLSLRSFLLS